MNGIGRKRFARLGPGAAAGLGEALAPVAGGRLIALGSRSYTADQHEAMCGLAGRRMERVEAPSELDTDGVRRLRAEMAGVAALVGVGGGAVMDAAKAAARPGASPYLVLLPKTLSGSEHTANTSWWEGGAKHVEAVGWADAVLTDPDLLVTDAEVVGLGALHCVAHTLATVTVGGVLDSVRWAAASAARDLVRGLAAEGDAVPLTRGAWKATVAFALTGPAIGFHHWLVHTHARPGEHARLSAYLLCNGLARTTVYAPAVAVLGAFDPALPAALAEVAAKWAQRLEPVDRREVPVAAAALPMRDDVERLAEVLA